MCGIFGVLGFNNRELITKGLELLNHRGPDDSGYYQSDNLFLGHTRLAIQDLSENGHQPMVSSDGRYVLIFNGEIYNHRDLRKEYLTEIEFKSSSDTETVLYGLIKYGQDFLSKLNGIFAFAFFDNVDKILIIVRDQFGVKPLYYALENGCLFFASEIKAFKEFVSSGIDESALANYLYFLWSPGDKTPFKNVRKLLAGHYIKLNTEKDIGIIPVQYYEIPFLGNSISKTESEIIDELDALLNQAVKRQLLSDAKIGFFLSGGLDSSLLVAIAKQYVPLDEKIECFTIETENSKDGFVEDLPFAIKVAEYLNVNLNVVQSKSDIVEEFDTMIYHLDEPQADPAPLNVLKIADLAQKKGIKVLIGGTGGDDVFSGYRRHQFYYYHNKIVRFVPLLLRQFLIQLLHIVPKSFPNFRRLKKISESFRFENEYEIFSNLYGWLSQSRVKKLFRRDISFEPHIFFKESLNQIPSEENWLNRMLFWDMKFFLTDHNLNYTDKMGMARGIEIRVPFLDIDLVEFSTRIPVHLKLNGVNTKYILKKVAERYLPNEVIYRKKTGFGAPVRDWILNDLRDKITKDLLGPETKMTPYFKPEEIKKLIDDNQKGKVDASYSIWALLAINSWLKQFAK